MSKRHTVSIRHSTYEELKSAGKFGESFSDLLSRLLNELRGEENKSESLHKVVKSKQSSRDIRFPPLQSSESRIPQQ
jgi:predicted CopG family antitoxin